MKATCALLGAVLVAGCGSSRIENGVFYSPKGYQVSLPRQGWAIKPGGAAELELARQDPAGGMLADATCDDKTAGRPLAVLSRHLTFGIQGKEVLEREDLTVAGHHAFRMLFEGRLDGAPVQVEAYVVKGAECVYDLIYVAPPAEFAAGTADFRALVSSFTGP